MLDGMMQSAIRAMGFEPEEFREMVTDALNSMVEMRSNQKDMQAQLDRIERKIDSETIPAIPHKDESQKEATDAN